MSDFLRRIRRLQDRLRTEQHYVRLIYVDGSEKLVCSMDAFNEILQDHSVVDVRCAGEEGQSFFTALLESEQACGGGFEDLAELQE